MNRTPDGWPPRRPHRRRRQTMRGMVLVVVMLMLLATMVLASASFKSAALSERIAGNSRDRQTAFQAAEAALRDAEAMVRDNSGGPFEPLRVRDFKPGCDNGQCLSSPQAPLWPQLTEADWAGPKTLAYGARTGAAPLAALASQPRIIVEYQGTVQPIEPGMPCVAMFLITARATGLASTTNVILQSVYRLRAGECYAAI